MFLLAKPCAAAMPTAPELVKRIVQSIHDGEEELAKADVAELERRGTAAEDAIPELLPLLNSDQANMVITAVHLLGHVGARRPDVVEPLVKQLSHENFHVQYWVCRSLAKLKTVAKPAVPALIAKLKQANVSVRRHAAMALGDIGPEIGQPGVDALIDAIYDRVQPVRADVIVALGKLGEVARPAVPTLRTVMRKRELNVRIEAAFSVWSLTGELDATLPILIEELDGDIAPWEAAAAIGRIGPSAKRAVPALIQQLESEEPEIRAAAATALGRIGPASATALTTLAWLLDDPEEDVQLAANEAWCLIQQGD